MEEYKFDLDKCNSIEVPDEINDIINNSVLRAKKEERNKKQKRIIKYLSSIAASLVIFILFINMSPAVASSLSKVPGLEYLVELVTFDKGLKSAIENNFAQHIKKSIQDKNIKLTIKDVIVDKRNMIIAYEVSSVDKSYQDLNISFESPIEITDDKNNKIIGSIQRNNYPDEDFKITGKKHGIITARFKSDISSIPENVKIIVKEMQDGYYDEDRTYKIDRIYGDWTIDFNIDTELANAEPYSYPINEEVNIGPINVLMKDMVIYPTNGEISYEIKKNEEYKFTNFINARLIDDKGQEYKMRGGLGSIDNLSGTLICESNYFIQAKELHFKADGALFIKKDMEIIVDLRNKKVLDDSGLNVELLHKGFEKQRDETSYNVLFKIKNKEILEMSSMLGNHFGGIGFSEVTDEKNNKYNNIGILYTTETTDFETGEEYITSGVILYDIKEEPEILKLKIDYANKGKLQSINIKVK